MEHTPPPFFKRGPAPLVRLFFFASLSVALLVLDARFRYADNVRSMLALVAYPLQRLATAPFDIVDRIGGYFTTQTRLMEENERLRNRALALAQDAQRFESLQADTAELRRLIGAGAQLTVRSMPAEILYLSRDPYASKVFIDRGSREGVKPGSPVADDSGVIGQVTRVHTMTSEVSLLTDPDQAIPVQVLRNGLRAVAFGGGNAGTLELRFMAANAEIQNGDKLVTSGIDGVYPPGLPVATVVRIERDAEHSFARVVCRPAAGVDRGRFLLVLSNESQAPPRPDEAAPVPKERRSGEKTRRNRPKDTPRDVKDGDGTR